MRVLSLSVIAAVTLAVAFSIGLSAIQESSADAYATSATRLDHQESVNIYGRGEID